MSEAVYTKQDLTIMQPKNSCLQFTGLEQNKVYEMDCLELLKRISDRSVDLIIADPPYYHMKGAFDFVFHSEQEYLDWCLAFAGHYARDV